MAKLQRKSLSNPGLPPVAKRNWVKEKLLNIKTNNDFDKLKDAALLGDRKDTNKLLSDTILEAEKNIFYLNSINQRLGKLLEINNNNSRDWS